MCGRPVAYRSIGIYVGYGGAVTFSCSREKDGTVALHCAPVGTFGVDVARPVAIATMERLAAAIGAGVLEAVRQNDDAMDAGNGCETPLPIAFFAISKQIYPFIAAQRTPAAVLGVSPIGYGIAAPVGDIIVIGQVVVDTATNASSSGALLRLLAAIYRSCWLISSSTCLTSTVSPSS